MSSTSPKSTILLLGGTGKVSTRIARLLSSANYSVLQASRSGNSSALSSSCTGVKFDWFDDATYENPFISHPISAVFLVTPPVLDALTPVSKFIELAREKGVLRFVLLSASVLEVGDGPAMNGISQYIINAGVDYAILRPTWFMENFSEQQHLATIRDANQIITAAGDGRLPFVSADDIADVAFHALTDAKSHNTDHLILGPELFTYDEAAALISKKLGRTVTHVRITEQQLSASMKAFGMSDEYADMLAQLDTFVSEGKEAQLNDVVEKVAGRKPRTLETFVEGCAKRGVWEKKE